ncbi:MAG: glycosyl transferase [Desulfarculus sp.]|nr:glycosyl transferase [Desulfarculus sp.]
MSYHISLLSFYLVRQDAAVARKQLRKKGIRRSALMHKAQDGGVRVKNIRPRHGALWGAGLGFIAGSALGLVTLGPGGVLAGWLGPFILALATLAGAGMGWSGARLLGLGVDDRLIKKYSPRLVAGETAVVVQASPALMGQAITVLRRGRETQSLIFAFHAAPGGLPSRGPLAGEAAPSSPLAQPARHPPDFRDSTVLRSGGGEPILRLLDDSERVIGEIQRQLAEATRLEQRISPSTEWILDNAHVVQAQINDVRLNLPKKFYHQLPLAAADPRVPRVYRLAVEYVGSTDGYLDRHSIGDFLDSYQERTPLTIGELWAFPLMLKIALIDRLRGLAQGLHQDLCDRQEADFWANRLLVAARGDPNLIFAVLADLARQHPEPSPHFAFQLTGHLHDEAAALVPVVGWLERKLASTLDEAVLTEKAAQAKANASIGNAVTSLRLLILLDWREVFDEQSRVERKLAEDPAGVYTRMDFETRNRYRSAVEEISRAGGHSEGEVAAAALALASEAAGEDGAALPPAHVGYHLIGRGRPLLAQRLGAREKPRRRFLAWVYQCHTPLYLGALGGVTLAILGLVLVLGAGLGTGPTTLLLVALLSLLPASQIAAQLVNYLLARLLPPRLLPKMSFAKEGIPDQFRTLVVVPMLLASEGNLRREIEKLEIRYLANQDPNLIFSLFSDYADADALQAAGDELLHVAIDGIKALNQRHGEQRFYLFHRERVWTESEQSYIGWERKRGKLEMLNRLISGQQQDGQESIVRVGDATRLAEVRFVITLDSDTQLLHGTARRLIETLAHPLNCPSLDQETNPDAYTIIQPRVTTTPLFGMSTPFRRLFTDPVGTDPYTKAVSDVYQDLTGEGSYIGKGIYDPRAFHRVLSGRFPEQRILSHDLLEGAYVRVGLASDIELLDDFPADFLTYANRQHRWIRGDWQIAGWCLPRVPGPDGKRVDNPLSLLNRWKILDNLRRSLVPASLMAFLLVSWFSAPAMGLVASAVVGFLLAFPLLTRLATWMTTLPGPGALSWRELAHDGLRVMVEATLIPYQAFRATDAIVKAGHRQMVSGRHLLKWASARVTPAKAAGRARALFALLMLISLATAGLGAGLYLLRPGSLSAAAPFMALWMLCPLSGWWLNRQPGTRPAGTDMPSKDVAMLREVARQTWRYFAEFIGPETSWLPPDNFQVFPGTGLALRTSPTNMGLGLLTNVAAHDLGYLTVDQVIERTRNAFTAINTLERYNGHLLNWYDIATLAPLEPRYVSTVDSGNLLASLWTLEQGLGEMLAEPLMGPPTLAGLDDTLRLLRKALPASNGPQPFHDSLERLAQLFFDPPRRLDEIMRRLRSAEALARPMTEEIRQAGDLPGEAVYWAGQVENQVAAWIRLMDRYLAWVEPLDQEPAEMAGLAGPEALAARQRALAIAPSLRALASGQVDALNELLACWQAVGDPPASLDRQATALADTIAKAQWHAGEMLAQAEEVMGEVRGLGDGMGMGFLYNRERRLFTIGYSVREQRLDSSYYDLLASEARLASFVAIARGDVPNNHWLSLSRPFGSVHGQRVLLSWSGTMFEYLMPHLLQRSFPHSLLENACRQAVLVQKEYAGGRGVPWGISEAAFSDLDVGGTYQYQAFGVPGLGLKRGLENDLVVSPYSTLLALALDPAGAVLNLRAMERLGLHGDYGFLEAIDFSRQELRSGEPGVIVHAYMAHHQAMGLLAIDNQLNGQPMQRRFHADPRVKATQPLLYERIPVSPPVYKAPLRQGTPARSLAAESAPPASTFHTPHTPAPKVQLLSNGRYALMVSNAGGGYSRWGGFDLTRWRADGTSDRWGTHCYLRDLATNRAWSNAYQPMGGAYGNYAVSFPGDRAEIRRTDGGMETETEIVVAPEDDVEIRRITLVNRSGRPRDLEVTSYVELALAPHDADRQHPAFNKLFVETEALDKGGALLATRRPRETGEPPVWAVHLLVAKDADQEGLQFETDRGRFIGRGRTVGSPAALYERLSNTAGAVLDPIFSLRRTIHLEPGQRGQFSLILGAAGTRDGALGLAGRYSDPRAIERQMDMAWNQAQLGLRRLRIQPDEARRFQELAGAMLYPGWQHRTPAERIKNNRLGQSRLWPHGISGDLPLAVVTIAETRDMSLVRQVLQAHAYWRIQGLQSDLVILNEETSSYEQPLKEELRRLIQGYAVHTGLDVPGGIFLRQADQMPGEDLTLLLTAARVVLVAARGTLSQQLAAIPDPAWEFPPVLKTRPVGQEPSAPLPFMELQYFNGLGGFSAEGREYVIYLGPEAWTPAPWVNVMANPTFGTLLSESGSGFTWAGNSQQNRLTAWANDPLADTPSEAVYIRDEESGGFWSPTPLPIRELDAYRARHGAGYTVFEHNSHAIEQEMTVFVPQDDAGGDPLCLKRLRLRNDGSRRRRLAVTFYAEWTLGEHRENTQMHIVTQWDSQARAILAYNRYQPDSADRVSFAALTPAAHSSSGDRLEFLGRNGSLADPAALHRGWLSGRTGTRLDPCAALQIKLQLEPGETQEVTFMLGQATSVKQARELIAKYGQGAAVEAALERTRTWWDRTLQTVQLTTPQVATNLLVNRWLLYQTLGCRIWGRSGLYQSGGAFGFRDQLQDVLALLYSMPQVAREHILLACGRQFPEGDVQHWWHPSSGVGVRTRCSDDLLWLPYAVGHYIRVTGDRELLEAQVPFIEARPLEESEHEIFVSPTESGQRASVYEHCRLAIQRGLTRGAHGLPLMGTGDWNDGMNRIGQAGRGESVWLAWFLVEVLTTFSECADLCGQADDAVSFRADARALAATVEDQAWDGAWYLRAFDDDGSPVGSAASAEARIDSLPQSWAAICGQANTGRTAQALQSAQEYLVRPEEKLVLLFTPPFDSSDLDPGYIKSYPPGVRENGGQYTHAALWLALGLLRRGDGDGAAALLRLLNPIEHAREPVDVARYKVEPYVLAADVYSLPGREGQGGWTWYTGAAGWMYRILIEEVFGLQVRGDSLAIDPVLPSAWETVSLRLARGQAVYEITVDNSDRVSHGVAWIELDGRRLETDESIGLEDGPIKHKIRVRMGSVHA